MTILPGMGPNMGKPAGGWFDKFQQASPLLMAMGQNMAAPPQMRDPAAMQRGMAGVMAMQQQRAAEEQRAKQQAAIQQVLQSGQIPQGLAGVLGAMEPGQAAGTLAQVMMGGEPSDFERLTQGMSAEEIERARRIKLGMEAPAQAPNARLPASVQEYEYARQSGYQGSYSDFLSGKRPQTNVTVNGPNPDKFAERTGTLLADEAAAVATAGQSAQSNLRMIGRLETLLDRTPTGGAAVLRQTLGEFGISTEGLDDIQAAQALINKMVPEQRAPGTGPMSDADLALFQQSLPRIINQPGGNKRIIETLRKIAEYDVQRGQIARQLQLGRIDYGRATELWNALSNPLADFQSGDMGPGTPIGGFDEGLLNSLSPEDRRALEYLKPEERRLFQGGSGAANPNQPADAAGLVDKIALVESGNNPTARNPRSTATGAGQFIESTWLNMIQRHRPDLAELPRETLLDLRNDPEISRDMIARYAMDNARGLQSAGLPVNKGTLYLAHFAGLGGAQSVLTAPPSASVAEVLGRKVIEANPFLSGKTVEWLRNWAMRKMGVSA